MPMPYYQPSPLQNSFMQMQPSMYQQNYQQPQTMQYQQAQTPFSNLSGRTVNNFSEITANDVPMTGGFAVFPKADLSEIEVRQWNANGTISARSFKPVLIEDSTNPQASEKDGENMPSNAFRQVLMDRLDNIERLLSKKQGGNSKKAEEVAES